MDSRSKLLADSAQERVESASQANNFDDWISPLFPWRNTRGGGEHKAADDEQEAPEGYGGSEDRDDGIFGVFRHKREAMWTERERNTAMIIRAFLSPT